MPITNMPLGVTAVMLYELDFLEQLALCQKHGVTHYTLRPRVIPDEARTRPHSSHGNHKFDLTPQRLVKEAAQIRRQMVDHGIVPFGTVPVAVVTHTDDELKLHFEGAAAVGAGRVRVQPEGYPKGAFDYPSLLGKTIHQFGRVLNLARPFGLKVVIETHCFSLASSPALAWNICKSFDPREIGTIFDLANFNIEGFLQPNLAVAVLADYIDHCHVGGTLWGPGECDPNGFRKRTTHAGMLTDAHLYIPDWITALRDANRPVPLVIESYVHGMPGGLQMVHAAEALHRALRSL